MKFRNLPFPENLVPYQRAAVEAVALHGSIGAAALALGRTSDGVKTTLQVARRRAQVTTTAALVQLYRERTAR